VCLYGAGRGPAGSVGGRVYISACAGAIIVVYWSHGLSTLSSHRYLLHGRLRDESDKKKPHTSPLAGIDMSTILSSSGHMEKKN